MNERSTFARRTRAATPRDQRCDIRDDVVPGLILRVYPSGARTFTLESMSARLPPSNGTGSGASASTCRTRSRVHARSGSQMPHGRSSTPSRATAKTARISFRAAPPTRPVVNIPYQWNAIREEAGPPGLRLHELRDARASTVAMHGVHGDRREAAGSRAGRDDRKLRSCCRLSPC